WIKKTVESKEAQFSFNARQSLINVAEEIKKNEVDAYYGKFVNLPDTIKPNKKTISRLFHIEKDNVNNDTYFLTNSILQEDYKIRSEMPSSSDDSIEFKKLINRKVTLVKKNDMDKEMKLSARERFERVSRMKDVEKALLQDAIKEKTDKEPI